MKQISQVSTQIGIDPIGEEFHIEFKDMNSAEGIHLILCTPDFERLISFLQENLKLGKEAIQKVVKH